MFKTLEQRQKRKEQLDPPAIPTEVQARALEGPAKICLPMPRVRHLPEKMSRRKRGIATQSQRRKTREEQNNKMKIIT